MSSAWSWIKVYLLAACLLLPVTVQAQVSVTDSLGTHEFAERPERIVALNWAVTENLVELGVAPVAIADVEGYRTWVVQPQLPQGIADVGLRDEPNIERLASLQPDVIIIGTQQLGLKDKLEQVAPVLYFDNYRADHSNPEAVEGTFRELARLLDREDLAEQKLAERDRRLQELATQLQGHFPEGLPEVAVIRFTDVNHVRVYGRNSLVLAAMQALGLEAALPQPVTTWGQTQKTLTELVAVDDGILLYIQPFAQEDRLAQHPLWQRFPFVQQDRIGSLPPVWTYGGPLSIQYLGEALATTLLERDW
ncbi:iron-siderophore ABC transporter substrate-binding protein [Marinospirillum perlucidum]|uniref:iron-siderophore ABC transporter substrate-binding protein n=1 Tax=Marinospirillum perlucidum TaxID=1982602 RepID=UPI000DF2F9EB|nr:iron-siderophore ABC transporter substrate-binding protein [Marinospirillum perlucidum]